MPYPHTEGTGSRGGSQLAAGLESSEQEKQDQDVEPDADPIGCEQEYEAVQGEQGNTDKESPRLGFMSKNAEQNENGYDQEIEEEGDDRPVALQTAAEGINEVGEAKSDD